MYPRGITEWPQCRALQRHSLDLGFIVLKVNDFAIIIGVYTRIFVLYVIFNYDLFAILFLVSFSNLMVARGCKWSYYEICDVLHTWLHGNNSRGII